MMLRCFGKQKNKRQMALNAVKVPEGTSTPSAPVTPSIQVVETNEPVKPGNNDSDSSADQTAIDSTASTASTASSAPTNTKLSARACSPAPRRVSRGSHARAPNPALREPVIQANKPAAGSPPRRSPARKSAAGGSAVRRSPARGSLAKAPTRSTHPNPKTGRESVTSLVDGSQDSPLLLQRPTKTRRKLDTGSAKLSGSLQYKPVARDAVSLSTPSERETRILSRISARSSIRGDPHDVDFQERIEREVIEALNFVRHKPQEVAGLLTTRLSMFNGLTYTIDKGRILKTKEGRAAVDECIEFLRKQQPLPALSSTNEVGLRMACEDHIHDNGSTGLTLHDGSDGSRPHERCARYGRWRQLVGECLWYGQANNGLDMVLDLIIDDGVPDRGHRDCIYTASYTVCGVRIGPHSVLGMMLGISFAKSYTTNMEKVNARIASGPMEIDPKRISLIANPICRGCEKEIINGVLTTTQGHAYHDYCFECTRCFTLLNGVPYALINKEEVCEACLMKHKRESGSRAILSLPRRSTQKSVTKL